MYNQHYYSNHATHSIAADEAVLKKVQKNKKIPRIDDIS
jgi:hypothetical protein